MSKDLHGDMKKIKFIDKGQQETIALMEYAFLLTKLQAIHARQMTLNEIKERGV
jgi:hypothetical protein